MRYKIEENRDNQWRQLIPEVELTPEMLERGVAEYADVSDRSLRVTNLDYVGTIAASHFYPTESSNDRKEKLYYITAGEYGHREWWNGWGFASILAVIILLLLEHTL